MDGRRALIPNPSNPVTFEYQFDVKQKRHLLVPQPLRLSREQTGLLGTIVIEPKEPDPVAYDREMTVLLSDWSDEAPQVIYAKLKKRSHYYNFRERTWPTPGATLKPRAWRAA